ncbi:MAG: DUF2933 domain-containing protein [Chloroflexi bacterium]|nr:DUF2933 domain-containing protein [Chloroflexota bacterium]
MFGKPSFNLVGFLKSRAGLVLLAFLAVGAFFLVTEHTAHVFGLLPYALLLLCPILHLFMHGGHGNHEEHRTNTSSSSEHQHTQGESR